MKYKILFFCVIPFTFITLSCSSLAKDSLNVNEPTKIFNAVFQLPQTEIKYEGTYHQEGAGPLGPMSIDGKINLTLTPSKKWPIASFLVLNFTHARVVDYKHEWHEVDPNDLPAPMKLPEFAFDKYGHTESSYRIGEMPLSMIGDLWPLPHQPIKMGESCVEKITSQSQNQEYDFWKYEGTRKISFIDSKIIKEKEFYVININTVLNTYLEKDGNPVKLTIDSIVFWDVSSNLPLKAKQNIVWNGSVKVSETEVENFTHTINLRIKKIDGSNHEN